MHGLLERRPEPAHLRRVLRRGHRRDPGPGRQRHPVLRRLHGGHHRHRDRRQLHQRRRDRRVFEQLITTYHVPRIDLDIEANSLTNTAGIDRRNKAITQVEDWAAAHHRSVQFSYTLPTRDRADPSGLAVLQNAVANGARVDVVNIMTFDYYDSAAHEMATDTETAAAGLLGQLPSLYPGTSPARLWHMVGVTEMPGIDDFGPDETFTTADAATVENWAREQRDRRCCRSGRCSATTAAARARRVRATAPASTQSAWYFSHTFEPLTRG